MTFLPGCGKGGSQRGPPVTHRLERGKESRCRGGAGDHAVSHGLDFFDGVAGEGGALGFIGDGGGLLDGNGENGGDHDEADAQENDREENFDEGKTEWR